MATTTTTINPVYAIFAQPSWDQEEVTCLGYAYTPEEAAEICRQEYNNDPEYDYWYSKVDKEIWRVSSDGDPIPEPFQTGAVGLRVVFDDNSWVAFVERLPGRLLRETARSLPATSVGDHNWTPDEPAYSDAPDKIRDEVSNQEEISRYAVQVGDTHVVVYVDNPRFVDTDGEDDYTFHPVVLRVETADALRRAGVVLESAGEIRRWIDEHVEGWDELHVTTLPIADPSCWVMAWASVRPDTALALMKGGIVSDEEKFRREYVRV